MSTTSGTTLEFTGTRGLRGVATALEERFLIQELLHVSDRTTCYLAQEVRTGRLLRLRVLSERAARDARQIELFRLEAQASATLRRPNIVSSSPAEQLNGVHFCTSINVREAETLRDLLRRQGWLDTTQAVSIALQIADALAYAREAGVLHLKLQPERVLLTPHGMALVTGFGIAANDELAWAHRARARRCVPAYLSPELADDYSAGHRSDLYCLGVLLYEMLTDRLPFEADDLNALQRKRSLRVPIAPQLVSPHVPETLSLLVLSLLERQPEKRPDDVTKVQATLRRVMAELEINDTLLELENDLTRARSDRFDTQPLIASFPAAEMTEETAPQVQRPPFTAPADEGAAAEDPFVTQLSIPVVPRQTNNLTGVFPITGQGIEKERPQSAPAAAPPTARVVPIASGTAPVRPKQTAAVSRKQRSLLRWLVPLLAALLTTAALVALVRAARSGSPSSGTTGQVTDSSAAAQDTAAQSNATGAGEALSAEAQPEAHDAIAEVMTVSGVRPRPEKTTQQAEAKQSVPVAASPAAQPATAAVRLPDNQAAGRVSSGVPVAISGSVPFSEAESVGAPPPPEPPKPAATRPRTMPKGLIHSVAIRRVRPRIPTNLMTTVQGSRIVVEVKIDETGRVSAARATQGPMFLRGAAEQAALDWQFSPATLDGVPVRETKIIIFELRP
ncbi:MAG TPA: protein kinase [Blastocatellia bacterium]|nr:protein kinase [Blastocatellia bacterium]